MVANEGDEPQPEKDLPTLESQFFEVASVEIRQPGWRHIVRQSGMTRREYTEYHRGMERLTRPASDADSESITPPPTCSLRQLWKKAAAGGAPSDALASVLYNREGYRFEVETIPHAEDGKRQTFLRWFDGDCNELEPLSARAYYQQMSRLRWEVRARRMPMHEYLRQQAILARRVAIGRSR